MYRTTQIPLQSAVVGIIIPYICLHENIHVFSTSPESEVSVCVKVGHMYYASAPSEGSCNYYIRDWIALFVSVTRTPILFILM